MDVPIVFLNCQNLYQVGQHTTRSPGSASQLAQKVADLAQTVLKVFGGPPALIGLCEVGERALAQQVADAVAPSLYQGLWSGPPPKSRSGEPHTALVLLHDPARLALTGKQDQGPKSVSARCKWLAVELQAAGGSFWAVVVHWKSRYGASRAMTEPGRANSAREIGEFWLTQGRQTSQAIILLGDLNCEPGEAPLQEQANRTAVRHLSLHPPHQRRGTATSFEKLLI